MNRKKYLYLCVNLKMGLEMTEWLRAKFGEIIGSKLVEVKSSGNGKGYYCFKKATGQEFTPDEVNKISRQVSVITCHRLTK